MSVTVKVAVPLTVFRKFCGGVTRNSRNVGSPKMLWKAGILDWLRQLRVIVSTKMFLRTTGRNPKRSRRGDHPDGASR